MDANLKNVQYQKALNFLAEGCHCGCYTKIPQEEFAELRTNFQSLSKKEQDAFIMAQLLNTRGGGNAFSPRLKNQARTNYRSFYQWDHNTPICLETYLNMLGISHIYLECIRKHLKSKNLTTRIHGNNENKPQWKTKTNLDQEIKEVVKNFIESYAEEHGLPDPGKIRREKYSLILLPAEMTYKSVHRDFLNKYLEHHKLKFLKYETFRRLWHKICPHIKFQSPRSDLCDTCHKLKHELVHSCLNETTKKEQKKKLLKHQNEKNRERDYYNKNIELARKDRKLVEENYIQKQGKVGYCSVDVTAHYSWDWAQNVRVPHFSQQPSQIYFLTARKVHLFGIQNEAIKTQINYVLDESEIIGKDPNGTLSPVFNGIKQFNRGEKHLKLTCDNAVGQNKNNITLWFLIWLVICGYYETVELNFMIAGHTKFSPDRNYGMIKKLYRKSTINCVDEFVEVVEKSSPAGLNKTQRYEEGKGFQYLDIKVLEKYFTKIPNIAKYHHFHFSAENLGVVKVQEFADSPFIEFNLWKDKSKIAESIEEIREMVLKYEMPPPLKLERQEYLYKEIRPLVEEEFRDEVCPRPNIIS